ncbi:MAG: hypothetical protein JO154_22935 [Chitinophaga sp.]|uniref:hypothetical protein n=1 Tax=Chitinophaga sp. TaxID=1869181 RepID=UPI0025C3CB92|nr:hypothetical protein [Chitinophaga sp.]MBV8255471.1 hypothetical protein [Chitinophaga sp.]
MKRWLITVMTLLGFTGIVSAQELYVNTEPASNMPANSLGIRLTGKTMNMDYDGSTAVRLEPEVMWGINKKLMVHLAGYTSNMMQAGWKVEGGSIYAKYRFLSQDQQHAHFRMAAYVKGSLINNPFMPVMGDSHMSYVNADGDLDGNNSGVTGGIIATQLLHKLALSGTAGYSRYLNNTRDNLPPDFPRNAINYSFSAGYLVLPVKYKSYKQTNLNLYVEFLGKTNVADAEQARGSYLDIAPAVQLIFNSTTRLDFSYRTQLAGNMPRNMYNSCLIRLEHNIFNIIKKR